MNSSPGALRLIGLAAFASMAATRVCDAMLVTLADEFQVSKGDASAVISWYAIAYGVMQWVYGPLGDRFGKLRVIVLGASCCALFSAFTALAPTFDGLVAARVAMGAAAAGIVPLSMAWIGDQVAYEKRQETLARLMGATVSGMMFGQWFGGLAADMLGWRTAFGVLAALFCLAAWRLHAKMAALDSGAPAAAMPAVSVAESGRNIVRLLHVPRVRWVLAVTALEGALAFGTLAFAPSQLVQNFGLSAASAGAVMILYGVGGLIYSQFARRWLGWLGEKGLARTGAVLIASGLLTFAWAERPLWGAIACGVAGLGFYMLHNTLQVQATQMAPQSRGTAVTLFASVLFFGQSLGVMIVGMSVDSGVISQAFTAAAIGVLVLGGLVSRQVRSRSAPPAV